MRKRPESESRRILLVFAKAPAPGAVKTRIAAVIGEDRAAELYRLMGRAIVDAVRGGRYRTVIYFDPPAARAQISTWLGEEGLEFLPQPAGGLGERLVHGFEWGFGEGDLVCAIGTDAPGLGSAEVIAAFEILEERGGVDLVLGPATDGGYYLVALRARNPALFEEIPWSTERVLGATLAHAEAQGRTVRLLHPLADVDRPEDIPQGFPYDQ
jgi:uncharacterized protein